jgi:hypothetical protein
MMRWPGGPLTSCAASTPRSRCCSGEPSMTRAGCPSGRTRYPGAAGLLPGAPDSRQRRHRTHVVGGKLTSLHSRLGQLRLAPHPHGHSVWLRPRWLVEAAAPTRRSRALLLRLPPANNQCKDELEGRDVTDARMMSRRTPRDEFAVAFARVTARRRPHQPQARHSRFGWPADWSRSASRSPQRCS